MPDDDCRVISFGYVCHKDSAEQGTVKSITNKYNEDGRTSKCTTWLLGTVNRERI